MSQSLGRYELLRPLARGGMAEVYLARRRAAGVEKLLVIKRIRPERANDVEFLELFVKEARLSMSLTHQNIVPVFDFGRTGDQVYLAMERVEGKDLASTLARAAGPLAPLVAAYVAAECCSALEYAHGRTLSGEKLGVVHRDLSLRNILVSWSGEVKLADFGIAALAGDAAGRLLGTPAYMAPEQARCEPVDERTDLYGLGLVIREAVTGKRARPGRDREEMLRAAREGLLEPWPADAPPALAAILDRATSPRPDDRFANAREMLLALDELIVHARAAQSGPAPARALATWMAQVWDGEADDASPGAVPDTVFDSFFDDAPGTGTARSLLLTEADAPEPPPPLAASPGARRRSWRGLALVAAATVAGVLASARLGARESPTGPGAPTDATIASVMPPHDAQVAAVASVAPDGSVAPDAATLPPTVEPTTSTPVRRAPKRASASAVASSAREAPVSRKVTINAIPWAHFTVDDDPTVHQTIETLSLVPGPHRLRFSNPALGIERTVTIEVPRQGELRHVENLQR